MNPGSAPQPLPAPPCLPTLPAQLMYSVLMSGYLFANAWTRLSLTQSMAELPADLHEAELVRFTSARGLSLATTGSVDDEVAPPPAYAPGSQVRQRRCRQSAALPLPLRLRLCSRGNGACWHLVARQHLLLRTLVGASTQNHDLPARLHKTPNVRSPACPPARPSVPPADWPACPCIRAVLCCAVLCCAVLCCAACCRRSCGQRVACCVGTTARLRLSCVPPHVVCPVLCCLRCCRSCGWRGRC